ncbi:MAG TPA: YCF48-related protein [Usitatibacter sp.]|nr:YCF48-related protein [Usitatibacter sp.]
MDPRTLLVAAAALGALACPAAASPGAFEPEAIVRRVDRVAILALAHAGGRLVAAGERGRILVSDDGGASWKVASSPTYQTLTSLSFSDAKTGFATGHQGVLLRTEDGGLTWKQAAVDMKEKPALFAVRVTGEKGIAVGAYGACLESSDGGRTWSARKIGAGDFDRHLTGIAAFGPGRMILAGEAGSLFATADDGATWQALKSPYEGSFFGAIGTSGGTVIAYGMRGNAWRSADAGKTWQAVDLGGYKGALLGATELDDGSLVLAGADGMIAVSRDGGTTFTARPLASRAPLTAALRDATGWIVAGPAGLRVIR